jgi:hypothetical protein
MSLPTTRLTAALHQHWTEEFPSEIPTLYPGTRLDTAALSTWTELWLNQLSESPHRTGHPESLDLSITVHVFSRHPTDKRQLQETTDAVRTALTHRQIAVRSTADPESQLLGWLSIREPQQHDLTRNHTTDLADQLAHAVLVFPAKAIELLE